LPRRVLLRRDGEVHPRHKKVTVAEDDHLRHVDPVINAAGELHRTCPRAAIIFRAEETELVLAPIKRAQIDPTGEPARRLINDEHFVVV